MRCRGSSYAVLVVLLGCGGASDDTSGDGGADADAAIFDAGSTADGATRDAGDETSDPDAFYASYAEAACVRERRCEALDPLVEDSHCHPDYRSHFWELALEAWRSGRAVADPEAVRACLEALRGEGCEPRRLDPPPDECLGMLIGTVPEGGECPLGLLGPFSFECEPGLTCISEGSCPGRCGPPSTEGEPCSPAHECGPDSRCEDGLCIRLSALGEPCSESTPCEGLLACIDGTCSEGVELGEPCDYAERHCRPGLSCRPDASDALYCVEWYGTAEGDRCNPGIDLCDFPLVCDGSGAEGTCVTGQPPGGTCGESMPCGPGSRCVDATCREVVSPESQCDAERVCPLTHECVGDSCEPLPSVGEPCPDGRCAFARCEAGLCVEVEPEAGEPCRDNLWHCAPGYHCADVGGELVCRAACE